MLQVALVGYKTYSSSSVTYYDQPWSFYEPGYNILYPIEFSVGDVDYVYLHIRNRSNATYSSIDVNGMILSAYDATSGESLTSELYELYSATSDYSNGGALALITLNSGSSTLINKSRVVECFVSDTDLQDFLFFRLYVQNNNRGMNILVQDPVKIEDRPTGSTFVSSSIVNLSDYSSLQILLSPYSAFYEYSTSYDFSYPVDSVYYKLSVANNLEDYSFSISTYSPDFMEDLTSIYTVPYFHKVGCLMVDKYTESQFTGLTQLPYVDVLATGQTSGMTDTIRLYFTY